MKKTIVVLVLLAAGGLGAFRAAQVISAKKEEPKRSAANPVPLVETAPAVQGPIEERVVRSGDIAPSSQVTVYSKVQGWIERIEVREGDWVKAGQVLVTLDSREAKATVEQAEASLEAAQARLKQVRATSEEAVQSQIQHTKANLELAESDLRRFRELYEKNFISRQQLDEARAKHNVARAAYDLAMNSLRQRTWENDLALAEAQVRQAKATLTLQQAQLANLIIHSPLTGGVTKRNVDPGTMVKDTTPILTLMDLREMKMMVNVIEREYIHLKKGQPVKVTVTAFPERTFSGKIEIITPALELQSRTAEIQISIPNPGYVLMPGMFGRAEILLRATPQATLIPVQALLSDGAQDSVFVLKDGKSFRRSVRQGILRDRQVEIIQGVRPGEQVITTGQAFLRDGQPVRLAASPEREGK